MTYANRPVEPDRSNYVNAPRKKRSCLTSALILIPFMLIIGIIGAVSLNVIKNKQPRYIESQDTNPVSTEYTTVSLPNRVETYLLLGSDYRPDEGSRTDVIILAAVNFKEGKVNLMSFPRDLWVAIPGYGENRINAAYLYGGYDLLADTFHTNFGIRPDHYALVDFEGFVKIVDTLGGVDINAEIAMEDHCEFNPERWCRVEPGITHMDGTHALWYARARYNTSDFDRTRRAQEVIKALVKKSVSFEGLIKSGKLFNTLGSYVETDLSSSDILPLIAKMSSFTSDGAITSYRITEIEAYSYYTVEGANVLVPDFDAIRLILNDVLWLGNQ